MLQKILKKGWTALILLVAFFPSDLKAQIFGRGAECGLDKPDCPTGYICNAPDGGTGRCQLSAPEEVGVEAIKGTLEGAGVVGTEDFGDLILKYVNFALPFLALAAFVGFVYAGFLYVTAYGNEDQLQKSKKILIYVIIGLIVVIFSYSIVRLFTETLPAEL